jgi:sugar lactone lactonase YvrE
MQAIRHSDIRYVGHDLHRPECIVAEPDGTLWVSEEGVGAVRIDPDGRQSLVGAVGGEPNGLAMDRAGRLYVAEISHGRVHLLNRDGSHEILLDSLDGRALGAVNFAYVDNRDRLWITVSTRLYPRRQAIASPTPDGYVLLRDGGEWRQVAGGFYFTNEVRIDPAERHLYVAETALGRVTRIPLDGEGLPVTDPRARQVFGPEPLFDGARVDGITFDAEGNLWVTEITRNAIVVIDPDGRAQTVFEDPQGGVIDFPTSITFAGPNLKTAYVGSLRMNHLAVFESPVAGAPLVHWPR